MLERADETSALRSALVSASRGEGRLVVLEGSAGIGKSRLVEHAAALAGDLGVVVLRARGAEGEQDFPFGVALQLLEPSVAAVPAAERPALLGGAAALVAELFDGRAWPRIADDPQAVFGLVHGLFWLVAGLAERAPLLLAVDDVQWADHASLRTLAYLAHRVADLPVALVVAVRTGEPAATLPGVAAITGRDGRVALRPGTLTAGAVSTLVRDALPGADDALCAGCAAATGGNPFLLRELLLTLAGEWPAGLPSGAEVGAIAPETVSRSVLLRLARLGDAEVALARAVAVLGDTAPAAAVAALAGLDPDAAAAAAARLAEAGILAGGAHAAFAHPLLRTAVVGDVAAAELARAHGRAAALLRDGGAPDEHVAAHLLAAPPGAAAPAGAWAVGVLRAAAQRRLEQGAPAVAVRCLERALAEPAAAGERDTLEVELGRAELAAGHDAGAVRLERLVDRLDPRRAAAVLEELGRFHHTQGRPQEAAAAYGRGVALVERGDGPAGDDALARELRAGRALAALWDPALRDAALEGVAGLVDRRRPPQSLGERLLLAALGTVDVFTGTERERGVARARAAWGDGAWLDEGGVDHPALAHVVGALSHSDEFAAAQVVCDAIVDAAAQRGRPLAFANASYLRGTMLWHLGRVPDAMADLEQALEAEPLGWEFYGPTARAFLALGHLARGERAPAEALLAVPPGQEAAAESTPLWGAFWRSRGELLLADDPAAALAAFERAGAMIEALGMANPALFAWRSGAARALARLGDLDRARELADEELRRAERFGAPRAIAVAARARGGIEPHGEGLGHLERAVAVLDGSPVLLLRAEALLDLGRALRRRHGARAAREPLREALDVADRAGAPGVAEPAREELVLAGGRPRRDARSGADALTPGELRVARLAASGRTNREIAEALFVTRKTVEWHLRGVYRKLDVNDREALGPLLDP